MRQRLELRRGPSFKSVWRLRLRCSQLFIGVIVGLWLPSSTMRGRVGPYLDSPAIPRGARRSQLSRLWRVKPGGPLPPNKRLKLTGGDRFKGNGVLCAGGHELAFHTPAPGGGVA